MSNPNIYWSTNTVHGLFVNITGNLTPAGEIWSGVANSPKNIWKISFAVGSSVTQNINPPHFNYDLRMASVAVTANKAPAKTYEIYADGFGRSSWGSDLQPPPPSTATPPYLPRSWSWPFKFVGPSGTTTPVTWNGVYNITLTWASTPDDLSSWRYSIDVVINCP